jgi:hypothetical protein
VQVKPSSGSGEELEATTGDDLGGRIRRRLFGPPIKSSAILRERMRKLLALPVLSADALSSVAYGQQAMLVIHDTAPRLRRALKAPRGPSSRAFPSKPERGRPDCDAAWGSRWRRPDACAECAYPNAPDGPGRGYR